MVEATDTVDILKLRIHDQVGLPPDHQRLIFAGRQLEDARTMRDHDIQREDTIECIRRLCGRKPIIYLYPPVQIETSVTLSLIPEWTFSAIYPVVPVKSLVTGTQQINWKVLAKPDGNLTERATGLEVAYLFWEAT
jgi:hypothetical protein